MPVNRPWTGAEIAVLRTALTDHGTYASVARELGRTVPAVKCKCYALGVVERTPRGRPRDVDLRVRVLSLLRDGTSVSGAARVLGRDYTWVYKLVREFERGGIVRRTGGATRTCRYVVCRPGQSFGDDQ